MKNALFSAVLVVIGHLTLVASPALAAGAIPSNAHIDMVFISYGSLPYGCFRIDQQITGYHACTTASTRKHFCFELNTDKGKAMLALANNALLTGAVVDGGGSGECDDTFDDIELLEWFEVYPAS